MLVTGVSILESGSSVTMTTDNAGNLYVPNVYNHRVLRYDDPFDSDAVKLPFFAQGESGKSSVD